MKKLTTLLLLCTCMTAAAQTEEQNMIMHSLKHLNYYPKSLQLAAKQTHHGRYYHWLMKQAHYTFSQAWYSNAYAYHIYGMKNYSDEYLHYATTHDKYVIHNRKKIIYLKK